MLMYFLLAGVCVFINQGCDTSSFQHGIACTSMQLAGSPPLTFFHNMQLYCQVKIVVNSFKFTAEFSLFLQVFLYEVF